MPLNITMIFIKNSSLLTELQTVNLAVSKNHWVKVGSESWESISVYVEKFARDT